MSMIITQKPVQYAFSVGSEAMRTAAQGQRALTNAAEQAPKPLDAALYPTQMAKAFANPSSPMSLVNLNILV